MSRRARLALLLLAIATTGCAREDGRTEGTGASAEAVESEQEALDRLRSLPYLGGVPEDGTSGPDGVLLRDRERSQPGYNLYSVHILSRADLMDADGNVVRSWSHSPSRRWSNCELLPNGDLLVVGAGERSEGHSNRYLMRLSWEGDVIWKRWMPAHHDVELTPRDQLLVLTLRRRMIPEVDRSAITRDDELTLLDQNGQVLDTVSLFEVFNSRPDLFEFQQVGAFAGQRETNVIDLFHSNSVEWMRREHLFGSHPIYDPGHVLISLRHQDVVAIVDPDSRKLIWTWGQGELSGPHDAQLLENGHVLVFDNGIRPDRQWSRVVELDPVTRRIVWQYRAPRPTDFFTRSKGSSQRLANGNTLIASSDQGWAFEVTAAGETVWEFRCPYRTRNGRRATIVRMKRYDTAFIERIETARDRMAP